MFLTLGNRLNRPLLIIADFACQNVRRLRIEGLLLLEPSASYGTVVARPHKRQIAESPTIKSDFFIVELRPVSLWLFREYVESACSGRSRYRPSCSMAMAKG